MKTVIFDFDGTLADSLRVIIDILEKLTGKVGSLSEADMANLRHLPLPKVAKHLGIRFWRVPFLLLRGRRMMRERINEIVLYQGLAEVMQELHTSGYNLFVVSSNSTQNVRTFLQTNNLEQYFTHVYGGIGLFSKAPALRRVLARNKLNLEDCIYVGDETRDIEACQSINLRVIAVGWGFADPKFLAKHNPTALVKTPAGLLAALQKENA